jgi:hypothetical protein
MALTQFCNPGRYIRKLAVNGTNPLHNLRVCLIFRKTLLKETITKVFISMPIFKKLVNVYSYRIIKCC